MNHLLTKLLLKRVMKTLDLTGLCLDGCIKLRMLLLKLCVNLLQLL